MTANAPTRKHVQFFDNNGSRAIFKDGWMACTFGPFIPWNTPLSVPRIANWDSATDKWELYNLNEDFSQANDLATSMPEKLEQLKREFMTLAEANQDFPIGAGNWLRLHPEDRVKTPYTALDVQPKYTTHARIHRAGLGRESNRVTIDVEVPDNANGVLYAVGGSSGGLTLYMDNGHLVYLYNMMIIEQYEARSTQSHCTRQTQDRGGHPYCWTGQTGNGNYDGRWRGSWQSGAKANRSRCVHRQREF